MAAPMEGLEPSPPGDKSSGMWNSLSLEQPPSVELKYLPKEATEHIKACFNGLKKAASLLTKGLSLKLLSSEMFVLSRLIYKGNNGFRHHIFLRTMKKIETCLWRFRDFPLLSCIQKLLSSWPSNHEVDSRPEVLYVPSRQMLQYVLVRLQGSAALMHQTLVYCTDTMGHILHMLHLGSHIPQMLVFAGSVARIWSLCRSLKKEVVDWYTSLRSSVDHLKATQVEWLVGKLPENIENFLGEEPGIKSTRYTKTPEEVDELLSALQGQDTNVAGQRETDQSEASMLEDVGVAIQRTQDTRDTASGMQLQDILKNMGIGGQSKIQDSVAVEEAGSSSSDEEPDDLATAGTRHMPAAQTDEGSREVTLESEPASTSSAVNPTQTPSLGRRVSAEEHPSMDAETSWQTDLPSDEDEDELNWQMEMTDLDTDAEPTATSAAADVAVGSASVSKSSICATEKLTAKSPVPIVIKPTATCDEHPSVQSISDDSDVEELDESNKDEEVDHVPEGQVVYKDGFIMAKLLDKFTKKIRKCDSIIQIKKVIRRIAKWIQRVGRELIGDSLKELSILQKSPRAGVVNSAQLVAHRLITKLKLELIVQETLRQTPERPEGEGSFNEAHAAAVYRLVSDAFNQPGQHKAFLDQLAGQHVVLDNQQCPLPFTHARCVTFLLKMAKKSLQKREAHEKELDVLNEKLSVIKSHLIRVLCHALRIKMCNAAELEFKKKTQMLPRRKLFFVFNKKLCSLTNFKQTISSLKKRQFKIRGLFYPLRPDVDISHLEAQIHEHAQLLASKDNQKQCKQARHDLVNTVLDSLDLQDERHSSEPEGNMSLSTPGGKEMETTCSETELGNVMEKLKKNKTASSLLDAAAALILYMDPHEDEALDLLGPESSRNAEDDITVCDNELTSLLPVIESVDNVPVRKTADRDSVTIDGLLERTMGSSCTVTTPDHSEPSLEHSSTPVSSSGAPVLSHNRDDAYISLSLASTPALCVNSDSSQPSAEHSNVPVPSGNLKQPAPSTEPSSAAQVLHSSVESPEPIVILDQDDPPVEPCGTPAPSDDLNPDPSKELSMPASGDQEPSIITIEPSSPPLPSVSTDHHGLSTELPSASTTRGDTDHGDPSTAPLPSSDQDHPGPSMKPSNAPALSDSIEPLEGAGGSKTSLSAPAFIDGLDHPAPSMEPCGTPPPEQPGPSMSPSSGTPSPAALDKPEPIQSSSPPTTYTLDSTEEEEEEEEDSDCCILSPDEEEPEVLVITDTESEEEEERQFPGWWEDRLPGDPETDTQIRQNRCFNQVLTGSFPRSSGAVVTATSSGSSRSFQARLNKRQSQKNVHSVLQGVERKRRRLLRKNPPDIIPSEDEVSSLIQRPYSGSLSQRPYTGLISNVPEVKYDVHPRRDGSVVMVKKKKNKPNKKKRKNERKKAADGNHGTGASGTNSVQDANANRNTKANKGTKAKKGKANKNSEAANGPNTRNPAKTNFIVGANADPIPSHNVGSRLMQKMGWTPGSGLGRQGTGITDPVEVVFRLGRKGIGAAPVPRRGQQQQTQQVNRPYTFPKPNNTRIVFDDD